jgi:hypothetical protein
MVDAMFYLGEILIIFLQRNWTFKKKCKFDLFCFFFSPVKFRQIFDITEKKKKKWFFVDLKHVETHDWVKVEGDHVTIGMTHHA